MFRWLVNFGFLALPIAATIGILLGIHAQREASGQAPLFAPKLDNKVQEQTFCQKAHGVEPKSKGLAYTLNPNQWGWNPGEPGFLCMNVTSFNNQTYNTKTTAPAWKIFWQYPQATGDGNNVHAFSNVMIGSSSSSSSVLPVTMKSVAAMDFDVSWSMRTDNETGPTDPSQLAAATVNANVAIDMFMDSDKNKAKSSEKAAYEVMVWFAAYGDTTDTIGEVKDPVTGEGGIVTTATVSGVTFNLFIGLNTQKQTVLTWKASTAAPDFHGDIKPLIDAIFNLKRTDSPTEDDYLGYFGFGSEAYFSQKVVTFSVPLMSIDVRTS